MAASIYINETAKNLKEIFKDQKLQSPSLIISSPPYFDLLDYGGSKKQIGYGQKYDDYLKDIIDIFQLCYEVSSTNAALWLVVDTFKNKGEFNLLPFDIAKEFKCLNKPSWILRDIIIWDKGKNLPWANKGLFKNQHEYILMFTKTEEFKFNVDRVREITDLKKWWKTYPERYHPDGKAPSNVWNFITPIRGWGHSNQDHLCPFPFPLVEKMISLSSDEGDWILDPFAGSGTVLAIAEKMRRNAIGIDVHKKYKTLFEKKVKKGAEIYWKKRERELAETKALMLDFKTVNNKLRKLKVASSICTQLNKSNKYNFVYFVKDMGRKSNEVEIVVMQNGRLPKVEIFDESTNDLIKQAKINPIVTICKEKDFTRRVGKKAAFRYKFDRFYSYTSKCKMENVLNIESKYDFMYSDINIKLILD